MRRRLPGLKLDAEVWELTEKGKLVEEQCVKAEAVPKGGVDNTQERMPA